MTNDLLRLPLASLILSVAMLAAVGGPVATDAESTSPAPSPAPLTELWSGTQPDSSVKTEPYWPAIDPATGDIWVSSPFTDQFWIFGTDGTFKEAWGTPGHGDGQFQLRTNDPHPDAGAAIAFLPDGSFYLTDVGNYRVQHYDESRKLLNTWGGFGTDPGQFTNPRASRPTAPRSTLQTTAGRCRRSPWTGRISARSTSRSCSSRSRRAAPSDHGPNRSRRVRPDRHSSASPGPDH